MAHLSCWIGLDDSTRENGCVHYVPGSHRWNLLPRASFANDMDAIVGGLTPEQQREFKPVPIELKQGECSFHHPLMVHGSYANATDKPRRAVVLNAFRDGVTSASDAPLLDGVPPIHAGQKIEGQFFPLLFEPS
jgi:ectoine hydroxylase-related dioxygenase (phytanoyl-CoA dioxygenase family)